MSGYPAAINPQKVQCCPFKCVMKAPVSCMHKDRVRDLRGFRGKVNRFTLSTWGLMPISALATFPKCWSVNCLDTDSWNILVNLNLQLLFPCISGLCWEPKCNSKSSIYKRQGRQKVLREIHLPKTNARVFPLCNVWHLAIVGENCGCRTASRAGNFYLAQTHGGIILESFLQRLKKIALFHFTYLTIVWREEYRPISTGTNSAGLQLVLLLQPHIRSLESITAQLKPSPFTPGHT